MRRLCVPVCLLISSCAANASQARASLASSNDVAADERVERLTARDQEQTRQIAELSARLNMLESEARDMRLRLAGAEERAARQSVRIGARDLVRSVENEPSRNVDEGPPTVLTLYGEPRRTSVANPSLSMSSAPVEPFVVPPPPAGVSARLPVVALPGAAAPVAFANAPPPQTPASLPALPAAEDASVAQYRRALSFFREGRLDAAATELTAFMDRNPAHAYVSSAMYWRAEVRYAQRDYARAASEFQAVIDRFPQGAKAPEALLKVGLCLVRMGDRARAHATFRRVQEQYPNTEAARAALREDPS